MTLGLALGAGGARGWCHIGVLRELERQGVRPEVIAGTSMGAVVGAAWAAGQLDALEAWARSLTQARFLRMLDPRFRRGGLINGRALTTLFGEMGMPDRIEDLDIPFVAIATDMETGKEVRFDRGDLAEAIRASVAIAGVFHPHRHGDRWLLDGVLCNPVPISAARALGADRVIAVNPNARPDGRLWKPKPARTLWTSLGISDWTEGLPAPLSTLVPDGGDGDQVPSYIEILTVSHDIMMEVLRRKQEETDPAELTLDADLASLSILELFRADEAIDEGHQITAAASDAIAKVVAG